MANIDIRGLTIQFPVFGADQRSLKRHITATVGGVLGRKGPTSAPLVTALKNVTLQLKEGDRLGLVGHNGAGKTTLLRTIAGAYAPDEGVVEVNGKVASLLDLMTGMDPFATGLENIKLRGLVMGLSNKQVKERTEEIADFTELGPFLGMPVKTYSSGMIARLAFGITTAVDADVLLMDEWLGVGDASFRDKAQQRLLRVVEGATIFVFASHDFGMIRTMCNKFMGVAGGRSTGVMPIDQLDAYLAQPAA
jgi:lipopolysaccharide transport system ATP-binding protein